MLHIICREQGIYTYDTICMYYLVYDVIMRSMLQWYYGIYGSVMNDICYIYIICFHSLYVMHLSFSLAVCHTNYHTCILPAKIKLNWGIFKLNFHWHSIDSIKSNIALNYCSTVYNCGGWVVDYWWRRGSLDPGRCLTSLLDYSVACCPQLPLPGDRPVPAYLFLL